MTIGDPRRALVWKALLEVILISTGVFLGLAAEQWRSNAQHRDQARAALQRFKGEIESNRAAVQAVTSYHVKLHERIKLYLNPKTRDEVDLEMAGIRPVPFEHTAWDLAIATQSLADIDAALAFELARTYGQQQTYAALTAGMLQAMYLRPPSENLEPFLHTVRVYLDDIVGLEPALVESYGRILPQIETALRD
jgi:hypothetical protein